MVQLTFLHKAFLLRLIDFSTQMAQVAIRDLVSGDQRTALCIKSLDWWTKRESQDTTQRSILRVVLLGLLTKVETAVD